MTEQRHHLIAALGHSLKAIDDDYREEMRELRAMTDRVRAVAVFLAIAKSSRWPSARAPIG